MMWEDVAWTDLGGDSLLSHSYPQQLSQLSSESWLASMDQSTIEELFDVDGDREEFELARSDKMGSGAGVTPTRFPPAFKNFKAHSQLLDEDFTLFPSYEEPLRRDARTEKIALINDAFSSDQLSDETMPQETFDDTYLLYPPTRHVDYLTHDWSEEDISTSWRKVVADRQGPSDLQPRLENASWRMWAKTRSNLQTVSAGSINWTKDEDVTWLYGPLYTATSWPSSDSSTPDDSVASLKPSLKTPCLEQILMHRSVSDLALIRPNLSSSNSSQTMSRASSPDSSVPSISDLATSKRKTVTFHDKVSQCIAIGHENLPEESELGPSSNLSTLLKPSLITSAPRFEDCAPLCKIIEMLAPTTLKPEALPLPLPKAESNPKSWPSRTLSYFWDTESVPTIPEPKASTPYFSPPMENKSYFDMDDDEEGEEEGDEMSWNPPRPRKLSGNSIDIAPLPQECKIISSLSSYPHAPPPRRVKTSLLNDDECFEAEMFGVSLGNAQNEIRAAEDVSDTNSSRSSPSISEYMSSSTEEIEEVSRDRQNSDSSWSTDNSNKPTPSTSNLYSQAAESLNMGLGFLGATASAGFNDLFNKFEQASSTVVSSVTKDRNFATSCSSEFNAVYRTNYNFAPQRPAPPTKFAGTDDEEHWWMNV